MGAHCTQIRIHKDIVGPDSGPVGIKIEWVSFQELVEPMYPSLKKTDFHRTLCTQLKSKAT